MADIRRRRVGTMARWRHRPDGPWKRKGLPSFRHCPERCYRSMAEKSRCTILVIDLLSSSEKIEKTTTQRNTGNLLNPVLDALRHYAQSPKLSSAEPWQILFMPRWQNFHQLTCLKIGTSVGPTILVFGGLRRMGWFRFAAGLFYFQWGLRDRIGQLSFMAQRAITITRIEPSDPAHFPGRLLVTQSTFPQRSKHQFLRASFDSGFSRL